MLGYDAPAMVQLQAQERIKLGKESKKLRAEGYIPAELYGRGVENIHIKVKEKDFNKALKEAGESTIVTVVLEGAQYPVLIHDIQRDLLGEKVTHIDLYRVKMDEEVATYVPIKFIGEAPAVREFGGVLVKSLEEVEIEALPADLPHALEVDLSILKELHQSIHIKDIALPKGVKVLIDEETAVATITEQRVEEEAPPEADQEVIVEGEEKKSEEKTETEEKQGS